VSTGGTARSRSPSAGLQYSEPLPIRAHGFLRVACDAGRTGAFIGWVAYHEDVPLIRHDGHRLGADRGPGQTRAIPLVKVRQAGATTVVIGGAKAQRRPLPQTGRRAHKPVVVVGR
jgi:hypothetical protein